MKQQKLTAYNPNYPKKALKGFALAAAALVAMGAATGCRLAEPQTVGIVPMDEPGVEETCPPEEVRTDGIAMPEDTPEPEDLMLLGDVAILDLPEGE